LEKPQRCNSACEEEPEPRIALQSAVDKKEKHEKKSRLTPPCQTKGKRKET